MASHFLNLVAYSTLVAVFFAVLLRRHRVEQLNFRREIARIVVENHRLAAVHRADCVALVRRGIDRDARRGIHSEHNRLGALDQLVVDRNDQDISGTGPGRDDHLPG